MSGNVSQTLVVFHFKTYFMFSLEYPLVLGEILSFGLDLVGDIDTDCFAFRSKRTDWSPDGPRSGRLSGRSSSSNSLKYHFIADGEFRRWTCDHRESYKWLIPWYFFKSYLSMSSCVVVLFNLFLVFLTMGSFEIDWSTDDWSTDIVDRDLVVRRDIRLVFVLKFRIEAKVSFFRFHDSLVMSHH